MSERQEQEGQEGQAGAWRSQDKGQEEQVESPQPQDEGQKSQAGAWRSQIKRVLGWLQQGGIWFLLVGLAGLIAAGAWYAIGRQLDGWVRGLLVGGLLAIAVYILLRPEDIQRALGGRTARYGSNALLLSLAVIGIVVLLNYLASRYYRRLDVTEGNLHSLSPQSIQILEGMEQDIEIVGVYPGGQGQEEFEKWLDAYQEHTDRITYRTVDPVRQPGEADLLGWDAYGGGLVVRRGTRSQQVTTPDEQDITSALLKVSRDESKVVYFLTGHSEPDPAGYGEGDYGTVGALLADNNYTVQTLNLVISGTVPADAALLVVAGLETPLLAQEQALLGKYLLAGGRALIMLDPGVETGINAALAPWQVRFEDMLVVDPQQSLGGDAATPVINRYQFSQITKDLPMIALPLAAPIVGPADPQTVSGYLPLAQTSARSWGEAVLQEGQAVQYDPGTDLAGPVTVLAMVEEEDGVRLVLVGDSDLAANDVLNQIPNGQRLFLNAVNWLAEEESLIAIGPKTNVPRNIRLTMVQEGAVCFGSLILIPGIIVVAGVLVWLRRR